MQRKILPVDHYHLTFSGPDELTHIWRYQPKPLIDALFAAADKTLKAEGKRCGLKLGYTLLFHGHAAGLSYKAHLHGLISAGGVNDEQKWESHRLVDEKTLRRDFQRLVLEELSKRLPSSDTEPLSRQPDRHWRIYSVLHQYPIDAVIGYLSHALHGLVIDPNEQFCVNEQTVTFTTHHLNGVRTTTLDRSDFLTRYFAHIPPAGVVTVRHYGAYAARYAQKLKTVSVPTKRTIVLETEPQSEQPTVWTCPICFSHLVVALEFTSEELPPILRYRQRVRGSPYAHGEIIEPVLLSRNESTVPRHRYAD